METTAPRSTDTTFGFELVLTSRAWRRVLDDVLAGYGLSEATWRPLIHLQQLGDGIRQNELAGSLGIEGPSLVRLLDNLQAAGLIERREDTSDRRAKTLHLTPAGQEMARRIRLVAADVHHHLLNGIPRGEMEACLRVLGRIARNAATPPVLPQLEQGPP